MVLLLLLLLGVLNLTDERICDKDGCSNVFDIDQFGEWVIDTTTNGEGAVTTKYFCCRDHRD